MLHHDKNTFEQVILRIANDKGIVPEIIEKDYFVTLFLKRIAELQPNIILKGGTSLSKCYKIINRFSEDIDLNIEAESKPTESKRRKLKENIVSIINEFGFTLSNPEEIRSRRDYSRYIIDYTSVFTADYLKEPLIVETAFFIKAYPCRQMTATSIIYDYLKESGYDYLIAEYELEPFSINVQSAERTLIDKLYALGDYYLSDAVREHSRHIYDIYKLLEIVELNDELKMLGEDVFRERIKHQNCHSAKEGVNMNALLQAIVDKEVYKNDYQDITEKILFDNVDYSTAIKALQTIIYSKLF